MIGILTDTSASIPQDLAKKLDIELVPYHINRGLETLRDMVDVRPADQYLAAHIPGAINLPVSILLNPEYGGYLSEPGKTIVFYSNGNTMASEAWMLTIQSGFGNSKIMEGGMNEWYRVIMESEFTGERITAAENAVYEVRYNARKFFIQMNSLPDSLKTAFLEVKMKKEAELVGGCE